jgi:hypothetical protein
MHLIYLALIHLFSDTERNRNKEPKNMGRKQSIKGRNKRGKKQKEIKKKE